jgi:vancomycin resistance protein VanW
LFLREFVQPLVPFWARVELARLRRWPAWILETPTLAHIRLPEAEQEPFRFLLACHASPLEREPGKMEPRLQQGKERNIALASRCLQNLLLRPQEIFSYHHCVGRPTRLRGFRVGLELRNGQPSEGVGGGCCQISNALYLIALRGGMKIVERHRHALDLFPDHNRTVPFGCGATVFYNYADLRFENPLPQPVLLRLHIEAGLLTTELWTTEDPGWTVEIYEVDHRFLRDAEGWRRENRIRRRFRRADGSVLLDQEIAHNRGRVLYEPEEGERCCEPR